jgi:imidazolonepropionase-like amidohydrolase
MRARIIPLLAALGLLACQGPSPESAAPKTAKAFASRYAAAAHPPTLIRGATLLTGTGARLDAADLLLVDGRIQAIGPGLDAPADAEIIDAQGRWVTPGLIDSHSHLGVYPAPHVWATQQVNEMTAPVTAEVWAEHSVWPQDPGFVAALAGGVTTLAILPGSANLIGGRGVTLKNVPARTVQEMKFPEAPHLLKMACGENPRRVYGEGRQKAPMTNMGNIAGTRAAFAAAEHYRRQWQQWQAEGADPAKQPERNLQKETLVGVLDGEILVQQHCYRAEEMADILELAREFGFRIHAFHHAVEAYKIPDLLREADTCAALWADWWGFKLEAYDGIRENIAIVDAAGACAIVHSDSEYGIQRLNQEAAKAMAAGHRAGLAITPEHAIRWLTANPAKAIGVLAHTGTLEVGKQADVVLWNRQPFSVYALAERVWVDGVTHYVRGDAQRRAPSDFSLGTAEEVLP